MRSLSGATEAGDRTAGRDGRDSAGRRAAAGVYVAVVEFAGERRAARVVLTP